MTETKSLTRLDGWQNFITHVGTGYDKTTRNQFIPAGHNQRQPFFEELVRGDDMAARCVEVIPDEMTREWMNVRIQGDREAEEAIMAKLDDMNLQQKTNGSLIDANSFGGAGWILGVDDGTRDLSIPLNEKAIRSFDWVNPLTPRELVAQSYYADPTKAKYGDVEYYRIQATTIPQGTLLGVNGQPLMAANLSSLIIHESRVIRFEGVRTSNYDKQRNFGWGDSILNRVLRVIEQFQMGYNSAAILLQDFMYAIYKIKGFADLIVTNNASAVLDRLSLIEQARSMIRATVMDADGEEYERKTTSLAGFPEMLDKFMERLAAAVNIPVTLLMGQAPAGLNATGDSDIRWFYDKVAAWQRTKLLPILNRIAKLVFLSRSGPTSGKEPENWSIRFNPLWQLTELEKGQLRFTQAQADQIYVNTQVLRPEEVAISRFGGDEYSTDTHIDVDTRKQILAAPPEPIEPETNEPESGTAAPEAA